MDSEDFFNKEAAEYECGYLRRYAQFIMNESDYERELAKSFTSKPTPSQGNTYK